MYKTISGLLTLKNLDGFIISLLGFMLIMVYTHHSGIGISPDSIVYLSVARNIDAYAQVLGFNLRPLVDFPVFYPLFLSLVGFLCRIDLVAVAPYLNAGLFAVLIAATGYLIDTFEGTTRIYKWLILLVIAVSPSLLEVYAMLWSETLFILLTVIFLIAFNAYFRKRSMASLAWCASIAAFACITRYAGVTLIGTGLMLLVFDRSLVWQQKIKNCLWFGSISVSLLLANLIHNTLITGMLTGPRQSGILKLSDNIVFYGWVVCKWLPVSGVQPRLVSGIAILIFLVIAALFLLRSWFNNLYASAENCFAAFFIVYTVFIIGISTLSHFEQINNRLLSPVYIPMLIAISSWIPRTLRGLSRQKATMVLLFLGLFLLIFFRNQLKQDSEMYHEASNYGIPGYTADSWKNSETVKFIKEHPDYFNPEFDIYSNAHEVTYFNGGLTTESLPHRNDPKDIHDFFSERGLYLIWFDNFSDDELIKFKTLLQRTVIVKKYDFKDGDIFFIRPRHAAILRR